MSEVLQTVDAVLDAYRKAVLDKSVDAFMQLYDDDVRVFDAWAVWSYQGTAAWRQAIDAWFGSLGAERVRVTFDEVRVLDGCELVHVSAIVTYAAVSAGGEAPRAMQNRLAWVLRPRTSPRIVHEHTSAPIGVDDMKAILKRDPHR